MSKQIKFYDSENEVEHGGIILDDGNILCACCGSIIEKDEVSITKVKEPSNYLKELYGSNDNQTVTAEILQEYETWVDFSDYILE